MLKSNLFAVTVEKFMAYRVPAIPAKAAEITKARAGSGWRNTDAFCGDTVIAHRHDGASGPTVNQVKDEEQGDEYKDNTGSKGGNFR